MNGLTGARKCRSVVARVLFSAALQTQREELGLMAQASIVPVKTADGNLQPTPRHDWLDDFEAEFERVWRQPWSFWPAAWLRSMPATARNSVARAPRMDAYDKDNAIIVQAELPGLKKEDVSVEVQGEDLIIRGQSKAESEINENDYYRSERSFGSFYRRMALPTGVKPDQIQAKLLDGVLEVRIPRPAAAKPETKKIPIK